LKYLFGKIAFNFKIFLSFGKYWAGIFWEKLHTVLSRDIEKRNTVNS